jgi:hypothetical protein
MNTTKAIRLADGSYILKGHNGREEIVNTSIEQSFKVWGIWTFIIFLLSMLFGIIGMCCYCPYLADRSFHDFYYQKFIQTFLIGQYLAFWVLYNSFMPRNLLSYLHWFFKLMV